MSTPYRINGLEPYNRLKSMDDSQVWNLIYASVLQEEDRHGWEGAHLQDYACS